MRKLALVGLVTFATTAFAITGLTQPRRPQGRPTRSAPTAPVSPRIAQELGQIRWGLNHNQVLEYFRQQIRASYAPRMKNLGQVEQFRMNDQRNADIRRLEASYMTFDGANENRRWDTSFIGEEYTHNNNESMLMHEDARGNREFFFFINDRLWKRVQARNTNGARINFSDFSTQLEGVFGPGRRVMNGNRLQTVEWTDATTHLHLVDATTFYSAFCLVYAESATLAQSATLRRNAPTKVERRIATVDIAQPQTGNVSGDPAADIVDRITGKIRRVQNADAGAAASASAATGTGRPNTGTAGSTNTGSTTTTRPGSSPSDDPLGIGGLGF